MEGAMRRLLLGSDDDLFGKELLEFVRTGR
jgi:hypothetical protein